MQSRLPLNSYIYFPKSFLPVRSRLYNLTIQFQCTFTLMLSDSQSPCKVRLNNVNTFPLQKSTRTLSIDIKRQTRRLLITKTYFILFEISHVCFYWIWYIQSEKAQILVSEYFLRVEGRRYLQQKKMFYFKLQ